jgi:hypothetical protein
MVPVTVGEGGLGKRKIGFGVKAGVLVLARKKAGVPGSGNHGGVVSRERAAGKKYFDAATLGLGFKGGAQGAIGRDAAGN